MKNKKINLNWQSFLLGIVLCAMLVVFIGSRGQVGQAVDLQKTMQRPANMNDLWEKSAALETRLVAMDERLVRIEQKIDEVGKDVVKIKKALLKMNQQDDK